MPETREQLERRCERAGIETAYHDIWGKRREVPEASLAALLRELGADGAAQEPAREAVPPVVAIAAGAAPWRVALAAAPGERLRWRIECEDGAVHEGEAAAGPLELALRLPRGYHRLRVESAQGALGEALVVAAPTRCWRPEAFEGAARTWGPSLQLYSLRSVRNWGMGDFGDLARALELFAPLGAGIVGLNPLHALFPHDPAHASPYAPSSRLALNVLYLDVEAIVDFGECEEAQHLVRAPEFQARLARLREAPLVDYPGVAAAKFEVLERLYAHFRARHLQAPQPGRRALEFHDFQAAGGEMLRRHALHEALREHFARAWQDWPDPYRDPAREEVARFASEHAERVEYYQYLQWQAELQLARVAHRCKALGLAVGLYLDLAVSVDRAGSEVWAHRRCYADRASVGAPPDEFNLNGQDWGLPPLKPGELRRAHYEPFVRALRANMRHAGALRIDHVMALMRLYWIPPGATASQGAYVRYALDEMLAIVALESHRHRCMAIREELGTVPDEVRAKLAQYGVLSYRLLYFERDAAGEFRPPADYPREALVAVSTHDLPTLAGWWEGSDLRLRQELALFPSEAAREAQIVARGQDRVRLLLALERHKLLPSGLRADAPQPALGAGLAQAVHAYAAATPARVMMVQLEDALGVLDQANLPGTVTGHPNWRRKLPASLEQLADDAQLAGLAAALTKERPHPSRAARTAPSSGARVPRATYRLQLGSAFTFDDAARVVPYLARLGVSHLYCSPILRARAGSSHGYDIVDHRSINPELGGREGFERLVEALRAHGMGQIVDMVPNHMGVLGADNAWWMDVLENGPASSYAHYFDIDWVPVNPDLVGKVLLPVLGDHYGEALARGELALGYEHDAGTLAVRFHAHRFPIDPREYLAVLARAGALLAAGADAAVRAELSSLAAAFGHLPSRDAPEPERRAERARDKELHKRRLAELARRHPAAARAIEAAVAEINADASGALHALLEAQAYRLAFWRVASDEINYRRFFDINELAALRMEDEEAFEATHAFLLGLAAEGKIDGLRIDHPDGLCAPERYFARLQQSYARLAGAEAAPGADGRPARPLYVVAEKIAAGHERLPESWAVHGTTGYRFAAVVNGLYVDGAARARLDAIWRSFTGEDFDFEEAAYRGKRSIMRGALASELTVLAAELLRIARADQRTRDYTFNTLREALAEVAASMPVYRTYIAGRPSAQDRRYVDWAVARAARRSRAADTTIFGFVRRALLGQAPQGAPPQLGERMLRFAMKFQQFTAPVAAKGVEDTAFYAYNRLASLNEVGADPRAFGFPVRAFHGASADRAARWPHTLLATSTHDNKRSEDVRQRINVLSEMPGAWRAMLGRWSAMNRGKAAKLEDGAAPSRGDEYLLYQTLLGTFPAQGARGAALEAYRGRIEGYLLKAAREAKLRTSWISPNEGYERALAAFVRALLGRARPNPFLDDLRAQAATLAWFGGLNSLSMVLVKFTSPGVPDLYQGNELIDLSLVDPDNRRPVDYALRERLLDELRPLDTRDLARAARTLAESPADGRAKLFVTWRLLQLRARRTALMRDGGYAALAAHGARAAHVLGYARRHGRHVLVVAAPRLFAKLLGEPGRLPLGENIWGDTVLEAPGVPDGTRLANVLTGEEVEVSEGRIRIARAFASFPGAALLGEAPG